MKKFLDYIFDIHPAVHVVCWLFMEIFCLAILAHKVNSAHNDPLLTWIWGCLAGICGFTLGISFIMHQERIRRDREALRGLDEDFAEWKKGEMERQRRGGQGT